MAILSPAASHCQALVYAFMRAVCLSRESRSSLRRCLVAGQPGFLPYKVVGRVPALAQQLPGPVGALRGGRGQGGGHEGQGQPRVTSPTAGSRAGGVTGRGASGRGVPVLHTFPHSPFPCPASHARLDRSTLQTSISLTCNTHPLQTRSGDDSARAPWERPGAAITSDHIRPG